MRAFLSTNPFSKHTSSLRLLQRKTGSISDSKFSSPQSSPPFSSINKLSSYRNIPLQCFFLINQANFIDIYKSKKGSKKDRHSWYKIRLGIIAITLAFQVKTGTDETLSDEKITDFPAELKEILLKKDLNAIEKYINQHPEILNKKDSYGRTLLMLAALQDDTPENIKIISFLLDKGLSATERAQTGRTAFFYAVDVGHNKIALLLLEKNPTVLDIPDEAGNTPLMRAISRSQGIIDKLLFKLLEKADVNHTTDSGITPLLLAADSGNVEIIKWLTENRKININHEDKNGNTALHTAVFKRHLNCVSFLLTQGADINKANAKGETPILLAIRNKQFLAVKYLIEAGSDFLSDRKTILYTVAMQGELEMLEFLIEKHKIINIDKEEDKDLLGSIVGIAMSSGHMQIVDFLTHRYKDLIKKSKTESKPDVITLTQSSLLEEKTTSLDYENIVFQGGGVRGFAYVGALAQLDSSNPEFLINVKRVAGTSVGAITALFVSLGYNASTIQNILERPENNLKKLIIRQDDTTGCDFILMTTPILGYEFDLMSDKIQLEKNKLYMEIDSKGQNNFLKYTVIDPHGKIVSGKITKDQLKKNCY